MDDPLLIVDDKCQEGPEKRETDQMTEELRK